MPEKKKRKGYTAISWKGSESHYDDDIETIASRMEMSKAAWCRLKLKPIIDKEMGR